MPHRDQRTVVRPSDRSPGGTASRFEAPSPPTRSRWRGLFLALPPGLLLVGLGLSWWTADDLVQPDSALPDLRQVLERIDQLHARVQRQWVDAGRQLQVARAAVGKIENLSALAGRPEELRVKETGVLDAETAAMRTQLAAERARSSVEELGELAALAPTLAEDEEQWREIDERVDRLLRQATEKAAEVEARADDAWGRALEARDAFEALDLDEFAHDETLPPPEGIVPRRAESP